MDAVSQPLQTFQCPEKHSTVGTGSRIWLHFSRQIWSQYKIIGLIKLKKQVLINWKLLVFCVLNELVRLEEIRSAMI